MSEHNIFDEIPELIKSKGKYEDIILYALATNKSLKPEDFINDSEKSIKNRMNKNTFYKWMRFLKKNNWVETEKKDKHSNYSITRNGQNELLRRLKDYNLDFKTLSKIEQQRMDLYIKTIKKFFENYLIFDDEIKTEFLELANVITCDKFSNFSEEKFNLFLLYLTLNHPKFYPNVISMENFLINYNINLDETISETDLKYLLQEIVEKDIYSIKFFILNLNSDKKFYFASSSEYGIFFETIIKSNLKKLYNLKCLEGKNITEKDFEIVKENIIDLILKKFSLFHTDLEKSLYQLIDKYIVDIGKKIIKIPPKLIGFSKTEFPFLKMVENMGVFLNDSELLEISFTIKEVEFILKAINKKRVSMIEKFGEITYNSVKAILLSTLGKHNDALGLIDKIIEENPRSNSLYFKKAEVYYNMENYKKSLEVIEKAIKLNPNKYNLFIHKADTLFRMDRYDDALIACDKALELNPKSPRAYHTKSQILFSMEKYSTALELIDKAIVLAPQDSRFYFFKGQVLKGLKKVKESIEQMEKALKLNPENLEMFNKIAYELAYLDAKEKALSVAKQLIKRAPLEGDYYDTYGEILLIFKEYEEALQKFDMALELEPEGEFIYETYVKMGECYKELEDYEKALKFLEKGMNLSIERNETEWSEKAHKILSELKKK